MPWLEIFIGLSELLAAFLIWRLWNSDELFFLKVAFTLIAIIPFLGPFFVLWSTNMPSSSHHELRDKERFRADVFDRWRDVLAEKNPQLRYRMWKNKMGYGDKREK